MNSTKYRENNHIRTSRWHVITGAPCSGKTTLIMELNRRGHTTVPETARALIEEGFRLGKTIGEIRSDELSFQRQILRAKLSMESSLPTTQTIFFDRGLPDSIAYFQFHHLDPSEVLHAAQMTR